MSDKIVIVNDLDFKEVVLNSKKPVLVDFYATWCSPCRMQAPILAELAEELGDKITVAKVNVDECEKLAISYGINSIPALYIFKDGNVVEKAVGLTSKQELSAMLIKHL
ncbi:MAG: thioredoxin [Clostridia bacterium]|nr:thioredoxin [Clostridia bacterium]